MKPPAGQVRSARMSATPPRVASRRTNGWAVPGVGLATETSGFVYSRSFYDPDRHQWLRSGATLVGVLLALGVLSMTVGLVRGEAAADLRTLTGIGASGRVRRRITGVTAGTLALLGALLGTIGAYVGLAAGYQNDLGTLSQVPIVHLLLVVVGLPVLAAMAGWLLSGREPPVLARGAME